LAHHEEAAEDEEEHHQRKQPEFLPGAEEFEELGKQGHSPLLRIAC
jgi:hypothetical protein